MRPRIYKTVAISWKKNPLHELAKMKSKETGLTVNDTMRLIQLENELAKVKFN